jgi:hypothetical protein
MLAHGSAWSLAALLCCTDLGATAVILRDGRRYEVESYRIIDQRVVLEAGGRQATVLLAEIDLEATFLANAAQPAGDPPIRIFRDPKEPLEIRILSWKADAAAGELGTVVVRGVVVGLESRSYKEVRLEVGSLDERQRVIDKVEALVAPVEAGVEAPFQVTLRLFGGEADVAARIVKVKRQ